MLNPLGVRQFAPNSQWMRPTAHYCRAKSVRQQQVIMWFLFGANKLKGVTLKEAKSPPDF
jgi:hypothetical protein